MAVNHSFRLSTDPLRTNRKDRASYHLKLIYAKAGARRIRGGRRNCVNLAGELKVIKRTADYGVYLCRGSRNPGTFPRKFRGALSSGNIVTCYVVCQSGRSPFFYLFHIILLLSVTFSETNPGDDRQLAVREKSCSLGPTRRHYVNMRQFQ